MGVISCPADTSLQTYTCVLCGSNREPEELTAGMYVDGQQAFACNSHFFDTDRLYRGWANFVINWYGETYEPIPAEDGKLRNVRPILH